MSKQPRRSNSGVRQVLMEIVNNEQNMSSTQRKNTTLESIKLNEAMSFLQRKIQRQYSEIQVLSDQLSKEISLKEELAVLLRDERQKTAKTTLHLANANKANVELKKKVAKLQKQFGQDDSMRSEYEIKLNKYRDIVRKKDELLTKNQQKLEQFLKSERHTIEKEQEVKSLKESVLKSRAKEENAAGEIQALKKKNSQLQQQIQDQASSIQQLNQELFYSQETIRRLQQQIDDLNHQTTRKDAHSNALLQRLTATIEQQYDQLIELRQLHRRPPIDRPQWDLTVYKNEFKRVIGNNVKDNNLRRKLEKEAMEVMGEVERGFRSTMEQVITALEG